MTQLQSMTGIEQTFGENELIVSKTDLKGRLTYVNSVFLRVSGFEEHELLGKPHNVIRHPEMPRGVFKLLWETIQSEKELFCYVNNRCKNGDHYWVFAHVTPSFDIHGNVVGYHSNRRVPTKGALDVIKPIYDEMLAEERKHRLPREQWEASYPILLSKLDEIGKTYEEFIFDICM